MRKSDHNVFANVLSLLICGVLAGVVVAAAAFPAIAMSGLAAKTGAQAFADLPTELTVKRSPQMSKIYANDGKTLLASIYDENRQDIPLDEIPKVMQQAMIAAEDHKFYEHNGVDVKGIARAFVANKNSGETTQGASTLTMQYVRLSITYAANNPNDVLDAAVDTNARKLREVKYSLAIEKKLTKDQILEGYLNIAYFGNHAYGIYAASQVYFGKEPKDLTIEEAAFLAGLVKSPSNYNPVMDDGSTDETAYTNGKNRRDWVIDQMLEIGAISAQQATQAKAIDLKITGKPAPNGCTATLVVSAGFFCDFLQRWWMNEPAFGANSYERERALKTGGYKIISSLDVNTQQASKKNVEKYLATGKKHALMVVSVEPGTGKVRSMAVNRNFKIDDVTNPKNGLSTDPVKSKRGIRGTYPNTVNPLMSGEQYGYQFGSTFKFFTMVAALENGYPLDYTINAVSPFISKYPVASGPASCGGYWCPVNANPSWMNGVRNMWSGFGRSVNTYFAALIQKVGPEKAVAAAKELGLTFRGNATKCCDDAYYAAHPDAWGAFTLGVTENTPMEMANALATLAADGKYCQPIPVEAIIDHNGTSLDVANPRCEQRVKVDVARAAIDAARCPVGDDSLWGKCQDGTARTTHGIVGKPIAGKTGTTDDERTASFMITTKQLSVAGIVADPDYIHNNVSRGNLGGKDPHKEVVNPAVTYTLKDAMKGKPSIQFDKPSSKIAFGTKVSIPSVTCKSVPEATSILKGKGFTVDVDKKPVPSACPAGTVAGTSPDGSTSKGSNVTLQISAGGGGGPGGPGGPTKPPGRNDGVTTWLCPPFCVPEDPIQTAP
ncbi:MAG: PASTA domain-containing protein [Hamadaea sp.]|uniref:transglycosylase domain-containing protein n=1 Tax=Hamadaea sp. TaxID=2024425 RepID=UPI0017BED157|nr:transglycosylase domain-containing protein [Hamadaea sp.]NUR74031.1 PASTA domain-containing protein [Hamadaea sp.]NUT19487.1 PASTA domain-containing protein [Hamadaea sp.]